MDVTREDVLRCARLAALHLEEGEIEPLRRDMARLLTHASSLDQLDLSEVAPTLHILDQPLSRRADEAKPGLSQAQALANAPAQGEGHFLVPRVIDRGE